MAGVLVSADSVSGDGEVQSYGEFIVTLEEGTIDIRLNDRKETIWMLNLKQVEDALKILKRHRRKS